MDLGTQRVKVVVLKDGTVVAQGDRLSQGLTQQKPPNKQSNEALNSSEPKTL